MSKDKTTNSRQGEAGFSRRRRNMLKTMGGAAAVSMMPAVGLQAAPKLKIGYVSPRTGPLAVFAQPDPFILEEMRGILKDGITLGGKKYAAEIVYKDTQSSPSRAASVTSDLILKDKVDLVVGASTPRTTVPVANQCELHGMPCITTDTPWDAWFSSRGGDPDKGFNWTWHYFFGSFDTLKVYQGIWDKLDTNHVVGALWPNDTDGSQRAKSYPPYMKDHGYTAVDPGRFQLPADNFSSFIDEFKEKDAQVITGVVPPPSFTKFWTQAGQQGFQPKVLTVGKALEFPAVAESLGDRGVGLSVEVWWSPGYPYSSSLTGQTAAEFSKAYTEFSGNRWTMALGFKHSLFEVAIDVLKRAEDRTPEAIRDAIPKTRLDTITGPIDFSKGPMPNVNRSPLTGGQWKKASDGLELKIVENGLDPKIPIEADLDPIRYT